MSRSRDIGSSDTEELEEAGDRELELEDQELEEDQEQEEAGDLGKEVAWSLDRYIM